MGLMRNAILACISSHGRGNRNRCIERKQWEVRTVNEWPYPYIIAFKVKYNAFHVADKSRVWMLAQWRDYKHPEANID
jgi:hypothetical protein